jgi:hypothetical protein
LGVAPLTRYVDDGRIEICARGADRCGWARGGRKWAQAACRSRDQASQLLSSRPPFTSNAPSNGDATSSDGGNAGGNVAAGGDSEHWQV